uniref:Uncharacterized protein n=1 Tax=Haemonchus contortus TaxID=6289 RepID=A0A7I4Z4D4_HAECO
MTSLRRPDGIVTASRRAMEKIIYDFTLILDSHVYLPTYNLGQDVHVVPSILPSQIRHDITSMRNAPMRNECTAPGPDRIKADHLESPPSKPWPGFSRATCRDAKCPLLGKLARPYRCIRREIQTTLAIITQIARCL